MTWSSNRSPGRAGLTEADVASETELSVWTELKGPAELEAQARQEAAEQESAQREARHREEVEDAYRRGMTEGRQAGEQRAHLELAAATQADFIRFARMAVGRVPIVIAEDANACEKLGIGRELEIRD